MSIIIEREGKAPIIVNAPTDPALRVLWDLARAKFETRAGAPPSTKHDVDAVMNDYHALIRKPRGSIAHIIREICEKAPGGD